MEGKKGRMGRAVLAAVAIVMAIFIMKAIAYIARPQKKESGMVETLIDLENKDPKKIQKRIDAAGELAKGETKALSAIGKRDYRALFSHTLIVGAGLPEEIGKTKCVAPESLVTQQNTKDAMRHPDTVLILQGYEDACAGGVTVKRYAKKFEETLSVTREEYPEARLFVCLLPLPKAEAVKKNPNLKKVSGYNAAMEKAAKRRGIPVIDLSGISGTAAYRFKDMEIKRMLNQMAGEADL